MPRHIPLPLRSSPLLMALYVYWDELRGERAAPDRGDVDPLEIGSALLPNVALVDLIDGGKRVRNRLVGTAIVDRWRQDTTGKFMDEVTSGSYSEFIHSLYQDVVKHRRPVYSHSTFRWDVSGYLRTHRLYMPLTEGGNEIVVGLVGQTFSGLRGDTGDTLRLILGKADIEQHREILAAS